MRQSYQNHIRFYAPHHFVFYPVALVLLVAALYFSVTRPQTTVWIFISAILILVIWLSYMLRQHYALTLQNRVVRLELHYRYFTLTGKRIEELPRQLTDAQLFALRFASDAALPALVDRTANENTDSQTIKKAITDWKGDYHRV